MSAKIHRNAPSPFLCNGVHPRCTPIFRVKTFWERNTWCFTAPTNPRWASEGSEPESDGSCFETSYTLETEMGRTVKRKVCSAGSEKNHYSVLCNDLFETHSEVKWSHYFKQRVGWQLGGWGGSRIPPGTGVWGPGSSPSGWAKMTNGK